MQLKDKDACHSKKYRMVMRHLANGGVPNQYFSVAESSGQECLKIPHKLIK